jgi:NADH-quinone oxidoreductase subunit J
VRYSHFLWPGAVGYVLLVEALAAGVMNDLPGPPRGPAGEPFSLKAFSEAFLSEYWLHFELTSVLLVAAVVAALAVIRVNRRESRG